MNGKTASRHARANPANWHLRDLQSVASRRQILWHMTGSHCVFKRPDGEALSVPSHGIIKPAYVKKFVLFVKGF